MIESVRAMAGAAVLLPGAALSEGHAADPVPEKNQMKDGQVLHGQFVQERHLSGFAAPLKSTGDFVLAPGWGLIWNATTPFAITTVMSPAGLLQEVRGKKTMQLAATKLPFMSKLYVMLSGALTGDSSALMSTFNVVWTPRDGGWSLVLTPLKPDDPNLPIKAITANGSEFVDEIDVVKPDGDHDHLIFRNQQIETRALNGMEADLLRAVAKQ